jgi:hypothetical protein
VASDLVPGVGDAAHRVGMVASNRAEQEERSSDSGRGERVQ